MLIRAILSILIFGANVSFSSVVDECDFRFKYCMIVGPESRVRSLVFMDVDDQG